MTRQYLDQLLSVERKRSAVGRDLGTSTHHSTPPRRNGGEDPSSLCCSLKVLMGRNLKRKAEMNRFPTNRAMHHSRRRRRTWNQNWILRVFQSRMSTARRQDRRDRYIREGRFQPVDRYHICPVTQLKVKELGLPFQDQKWAKIERSQRRNKSILSHKNKLGS